MRRSKRFVSELNFIRQLINDEHDAVAAVLPSADGPMRIKSDLLSTDTSSLMHPTVPPSRYVLCVLVRGEISVRMFEIWQDRLPIIQKDIVVSRVYLRTATHIVLGSSCTDSHLRNFVEGDLQAGNVHRMLPQWVFDALKRGEFLAAESPLLPFEFLYDCCRSSNCGINTNFNTASALLGLDNPNRGLTDKLDELQSIYESKGDTWRAQTYKEASAALKGMELITSAEQLRGVPNFGRSVLSKIEEALKGDTNACTGAG